MTLADACRAEHTVLARHVPRNVLFLPPAWLAWLRIQEPTFLNDGAGVFWPAAEVALQLGLTVLPFVWITARQGPHLRCWLRASLHPGRSTLAAWGGTVTHGSLLILAYSVLAFTVYRIHGEWLPREAGSMAMRSLLWLAALASLAPAVAYLALPLPGAAVVWTTLSASSLLLGVPVPASSDLILPASDLSMALLRETMVAMVLATAGGLLLSVALARWRIGLSSHAHRHPRRHP